MWEENISVQTLQWCRIVWVCCFVWTLKSFIYGFSFIGMDVGWAGGREGCVQKGKTASFPQFIPSMLLVTYKTYIIYFFFQPKNIYFICPCCWLNLTRTLISLHFMIYYVVDLMTLCVAVPITLIRRLLDSYILIFWIMAVWFLWTVE